MINQLSIASIPVRQFNQLYSLNDLHFASGGEQKHKPSNFLRVDQTKELIIEIERCSNMSNAVITKRGGEFQGTFACKEIVYAYAMWISPAFMLKVIRAYDSLHSVNLINTEQKYQIRKAVNERAYRTGEHHQTIYHKLYDQFKINSYEALPASKFDEAIKWLGGAIQVEDNYDALARQVGRLEIIYDCQQKLHQIYMNKLEDFIEKLSPSTHYNISTLFNKIHVNLGLSLNYATTAHPTKIVTAQKQLTN